MALTLSRIDLLPDDIVDYIISIKNKNEIKRLEESYNKMLCTLHYKFMMELQPNINNVIYELINIFNEDFDVNVVFEDYLYELNHIVLDCKLNHVFYNIIKNMIKNTIRTNELLNDIKLEKKIIFNDICLDLFNLYNNDYLYKIILFIKNHYNAVSDYYNNWYSITNHNEESIEIISEYIQISHIEKNNRFINDFGLHLDTYLYQ